MKINGLPIEVLVILAGVALVVLLWLALRFGKVIGRALLVGAVVIIGGVLAVAAVGQAGANFEQSRATVEVAQVAQRAATGNLVLVGMMGCFGGMTLMAGMAALALIGVMWYRLQEAERRQGERPAQLPRRERQAGIASPEMVWIEDGRDSSEELPVSINWEEWV